VQLVVDEQDNEESSDDTKLEVGGESSNDEVMVIALQSL
jgi:hypothetical protein